VAFTAYQARLSNCVRATIQSCRERRRRRIAAAADPRILDWRLIAAKLALDCLAEVLQEMKTVSHLPRLRRALTRGLRIEASTVAGDDLHVRVILEPTGRGRCRPIGQHLHHLTTLQVYDDRAVVMAFRHAQSSTPATRTAAAAPFSYRAPAYFFKMVRIVVSLTGMPSRLISRSDGRPPFARRTARLAGIVRLLGHSRGRQPASAS
jgi:hypothetical protein